MKTIVTNYSNMDDLVFENRNIAYGAYALRQKYEKHLYAGLAFTFGLFALGIGVPEFLKNCNSEEKASPVVETSRIILDQPPPLTPAVPPPAINFPQPPPPPSPRFIPTVTDAIVPESDEVFLNNEPPIAPPITSANGGNIEYSFDYDFGAPETNDLGVTTAPVVFTIVEQMPEFKGDLGKFLQRNLKYPDHAQRMGTEGKVYLSFIVGEDGVIRNLKLLKGVSQDLDEEALRVVSKMPAWNPGKQSGKAVSVHYTLPIVFELSRQ